MKKNYIYIFSLILIGSILCFLACGSDDTITETIGGSTNEEEKAVTSFTNLPNENNQNIIDSSKESNQNNSDSSTENKWNPSVYLDTYTKIQVGESLDSIIPVFEEDYLLKNESLMVYLGRDAGFYDNISARFDSSKAILSTFPTKAVRKTENGQYVMCDTNTGIRMYLFFDKNDNEEYYLSGFPIFMEKKLSYSDFTDLLIGDSISQVQKIDPIISKYIEQFDTATDEFMEIYTQKGAGAISIHLLSDGILKIVYKRENTGYTIANMEYSKDFNLKCFTGTYCFKINDIDYIDNGTSK